MWPTHCSRTTAVSGGWSFVPSPPLFSPLLSFSFSFSFLDIVPSWFFPSLLGPLAFSFPPFILPLLPATSTAFSSRYVPFHSRLFSLPLSLPHPLLSHFFLSSSCLTLPPHHLPVPPCSSALFHRLVIPFVISFRIASLFMSYRLL